MGGTDAKSPLHAETAQFHYLEPQTQNKIQGFENKMAARTIWIGAWRDSERYIYKALMNKCQKQRQHTVIAIIWMTRPIHNNRLQPSTPLYNC